MKYQRERKLVKAKFTTSLSLKMSTGKINKQYQTNYSPIQKKIYSFKTWVGTSKFFIFAWNMFIEYHFPLL